MDKKHRFIEFVIMGKKYRFIEFFYIMGEKHRHCLVYSKKVYGRIKLPSQPNKLYIYIYIYIYIYV
jgi:hypothetical protein